MERGTWLVLTFAFASAASADKAKDADALFAEGQKLIDAKKVDEACEKFAASLALEPALGTRLNLADCRERQNRFVDAYQLYVTVAEEAARSGKQSQLQFAKKRLDALAPKVVRLSLKVAEPGLAGLAIKVSGRDVPQPEWARPIVLPAGEVVVDAAAPGHEPFHASRDGALGIEVLIDVPALAATGGASPGPVTTPPHARSRTPWIFGAAGGGALLISVIVGLHARSVYNEGVDIPGAPGDDKIDRAKTEADVATVFAIAGTIAVGVGVYLYVRDRKAERKTMVVPVADGQSAGAALVGSW